MLPLPRGKHCALGPRGARQPQRRTHRAGRVQKRVRVRVRLPLRAARSAGAYKQRQLRKSALFASSCRGGGGSGSSSRGGTQRNGRSRSRPRRRPCCRRPCCRRRRRELEERRERGKEREEGRRRGALGGRTGQEAAQHRGGILGRGRGKRRGGGVAIARELWPGLEKLGQRREKRARDGHAHAHAHARAHPPRYHSPAIGLGADHERSFFGSFSFVKHDRAQRVARHAREKRMTRRRRRTRRKWSCCCCCCGGAGARCERGHVPHPRVPALAP